ncbi:MAG: DEAD/DEAH box helicase [Thermodesulfobacteriota bacterium]
MDGFIEELKGRDDLGDFLWHQRLRPSRASYKPLETPLPDALTELLNNDGISRLYSHQAWAVDLIREGKNTVIMTPTASGKSLIYNLPVLESILNNPEARALYIFPLKGLTQDQFKTLDKFGKALKIDNLARIYDGDTTGYKRGKIRENPPNVILTNPDMLHMALLCFHEKWETFFKGLKYVVIDELHTYRGVFGSNVALVIRRLRRIAAHYGADPIFITCTATIANPKEVAEKLTGLSFNLVEKNGAPSGLRHFLFLDPKESPYTEALRLFIASIRAGYKTIAFTKARKITELIYRWAKEQAPEIAERVSSYRAGFLPEERREIESRLFDGTLDGVISTSALELGIDIGGLDVCILVGYPGTVSSTWQRAGRVGRLGTDSLIVMIAIEDALDKYFMRNPETFFETSVEAAVLDNNNFPIKKSHLHCAVSELQITKDEKIFDIPECVTALKELEDEGKIRHWKSENRWYLRGRVRALHRGTNLRGTGQSYKIFDEDKTLLGLSSGGRALKELHPGAIYLHMGMQYRILSLHTGKAEAVARAVHTGYFTVARTDEETEILEEKETKKLNNMTITRGMVRVTEKVTGYWVKDIYTRETVKEFDLELPEEIFTTAAVWTKVEGDIIEKIEKKKFSVDGGLHALEHAQIASLPLFALCDRLDLGGVSYSYNHALESPAIFIYDGHEGGVGLTLRGFEMLPEWLHATLKLMSECPCEISCPSCTQDQNCGNGNEPLDKRAAMVILKEWLA